jgi:hypothetical protein
MSSEILKSPWILLSAESPVFTESGGDPAVLVYCEALAKQADFPGHPYLVSNPAFVANDNARKNFGATHWMRLFAPDTSVPALDVSFKHSRGARAEAALQAIEAWLMEEKPSCAESVYQVDSVNQAAPELVATLCDIVLGTPRSPLSKPKVVSKPPLVIHKRKKRGP